VLDSQIATRFARALFAALSVMKNPARQLTQEEYEATFSPPMRNVTDSAEEIVDLWAYANPIIESEYHNCVAWNWRVMFIYESRDGLFQHVNIPVPTDNTYLSVVVDKPSGKIIGHYLLNLEALHPDWRKSRDA
jgi:hypothetical protein